MPLKIDYYTSLSRAVAGLDRDAYAARGAVYDREHKALMRRLFSVDPPLPDEEIERDEADRNLRSGEEIDLLATEALLEFGERDSAAIAPSDDFAVEDEIAGGVADGLQ